MYRAFFVYRWRCVAELAAFPLRGFWRHGSRKRVPCYRECENPGFFNSRETSTAVLFSTAISVLLCEDEYDKILKKYSGSVNFDEPVLYI